MVKNGICTVVFLMRRSIQIFQNHNPLKWRKNLQMLDLRLVQKNWVLCRVLRETQHGLPPAAETVQNSQPQRPGTAATWLLWGPKPTSALGTPKPTKNLHPLGVRFTYTYLLEVNLGQTKQTTKLPYIPKKWKNIGRITKRSTAPSACKCTGVPAPSGGI